MQRMQEHDEFKAVYLQPTIKKSTPPSKKQRLRKNYNNEPSDSDLERNLRSKKQKQPRRHTDDSEEYGKQTTVHNQTIQQFIEEDSGIVNYRGKSPVPSPNAVQENKNSKKLRSNKRQ